MFSSLSVSSMDFFANRVMWNQLTVIDLANLYRIIRGWYEQLHDLSRPAEVERQETYNKVSEIAPWRENNPYWEEFHRRHSKIMIGYKRN